MYRNVDIRTSTFGHTLGCLGADAVQLVWARLARQLALRVLEGAGRTELACSGQRVVPRAQAARNCKHAAHVATGPPENRTGPQQTADDCRKQQATTGDRR